MLTGLGSNTALIVKGPVSVTWSPLSDSPFICNDFSWVFTLGIAAICRIEPCCNSSPFETGFCPSAA